MPDEADDVVIGELPDNKSLVFIPASQAIHSIQSDESVRLRYFQSLILTGGNSRIDGPLEVGRTLNVTGPATQLIFSGEVTGVDSLADIVAEDGATVVFPNLEGLGRVDFRAHGQNSVISMPQLSKSNGAAFTASNGGQISLPQVSDCGFSSFAASSGSSIFLGSDVPSTENCSSVEVFEDSFVRTSLLDAVRVVGGSGMIDGDVRVENRLSIEGLHITGDLETSAEANWFANLNPGQSAAVEVGGDASIAGKLTATVGDGLVLEVNDVIPVVTANSLSGQFESVATDANDTGVRFEATYESQLAAVTAFPDVPIRVVNTSIHKTPYSLSHLFVEFNQPVTSKGSARLELQGEDGLQGFTGFIGEAVSPTTFRFESVFEVPAGDYIFSIRSARNGNGNGMDQDSDGLLGEELDDVYSERVVVSDDQGPRVLRIVDNPHAVGSPQSRFVDVVFSEPIVSSSFDSDDVTLVDSDGNTFDGTPIPVGPEIRSILVGPFALREAYLRYVIEVAQQADLSSGFSIQIGPAIQDINGLSLDQNADGILGASDDVFIGTVTPTIPQPVPTFVGNGALVELFYGADLIPFGRAAPTPERFEGLVPDASIIATEIDFPSGPDFSPRTGVPVGLADLSDFFSTNASVPETISTLSAGNFMLRNTFSIPITTEMDLDTETPEIEISFSVTSDDGYHLVIGDVFLGYAGDRSIRTSGFGLKFPSEGLYPVELLYVANDGGGSALQIGWDTVTESGVIGREFMYAGSTPLMPGDANADGTVDSIDLGRLLNRFNDEVTSWRDGDFDGDGGIDSVDLGLLLNRFGDVNGQAAAPESSVDAFFASAGVASVNAPQGDDMPTAVGLSLPFVNSGLDQDSEDESDEESDATMFTLPS